MMPTTDLSSCSIFKAFLILCLCFVSISSQSPESLDSKLDRMFLNVSGVNGDPQEIVQGVLINLIRFGYLSHDLLARASSTNRQIVELLDLWTIQRALRKYQQKMRLPRTGIIDGPTLYDQAMPRCGNKDVDRPIRPYGSLYRVRRYKLHREGMDKWNKTDLTYSVMNYPSKGLSKSQVRRILRRAVNAWSKVSSLNFKEIIKSPRADIRFRFKRRKHGDGISFDGPNGILAHAFYPKSGSLTGEVHFDDDENWTDQTYKGKNLLGVGVHELGHALGLAHSKTEKSIMFGIFIGYQSPFKLNADDVSGIQALYGPPQPNKKVDEDEDYYTPPPFVPTTPTPTPFDRNAPDVCNTNVDTILSMRGYETQVFYEKFFWRVTRSETGDGFSTYELRDSPRPFSMYWRALPPNLERIDAAYERQSDQNIMFFRGDRFWILKDNVNLISSIPRQGRYLQEIGLPHTVKKIDALFEWGYVPSYVQDRRSYQRRVFLFANDLYWEYYESRGTFGGVDHRRYPMTISNTWNGIPSPVDAVYTHTDDQTYFFKDEKVYWFNNRRMRVQAGYPTKSRLSWLGCTVNEFLRSRRNNY